MGGYDVEIMDPTKVPLHEQIQRYAKTNMVISTWGGISMFNFLMPSGSAELVITSWDRRQGYTKGTVKNVECPDFDRGIHNSITHVDTVAYCGTSDGWSRVRLSKAKFMEKFEFAKSIVENNFNFDPITHKKRTI